MTQGDTFSRLELNAKACVDNYRYFRSLLLPSTKLLVLVKANAYGHGSVAFANMMQRAGADYLAVAYPVEGAELRASGISLPILVLTAGTDAFAQIVSCGLEPSIPNVEALEKFVRFLRERGMEGYPIHIKLDTGMHRLGFSPEEIPTLTAALAASGQTVRVVSLFSHLCVAEDPTQDAFTESQFARFDQMAETLTATLGYSPMRHILNSAGIERFPQRQMDMVRLGIGVYGISAIPGKRLAPAASLKCKILQIKQLHEDDTVGYGRRGKGREGMVTATIPVGYADGIDRHLGCGAITFSLNGHRVPTLGNICMDMCMLDVTGVPAQVGDTVTIFGEDPLVTELSDALGTIPYEILASIPRRIKRVVVP